MEELLRKLENNIKTINSLENQLFNDTNEILITVNEAELIIELIKHQLIECKDRAKWSMKLKDVGDEKEKTIDSLTDLPNITRVEVIDETGRAYVNWNEKNKVVQSIQDNGKTLKIFIKKEKE